MKEIVTSQDTSLINKSNSLVLKGIGILLMLWHHLFFSAESSDLYWDYHIYVGSHNFGIVNQLGIYCKLCVALFVFVSGYGLEVTYKSRELDVLAFYKHRFKKLYFNYWFIWLIFVPISIFFFGQSLSDAYNSHLIPKMLLDILGILNLTGQYGFNPTWWFYSCIIVLYLLFPLLHTKLSNSWLLCLSIGVLLPRLSGVPIITSISNYLFPFLVGMCVARLPVRVFDRLKIIETIIAFLILSLARNLYNLDFVIDTLLCIILAVFIYRIKVFAWLYKVLYQLGKHSQNIFLFHTFIYYYWFQDLIYISRNPVFIFITLVIICYLLSVVIELIKQKIGFYKFTT